MISISTSFIILLIGFSVIYLTNYLVVKHRNRKYDKKEVINNSMGTILIIFGLLKIINLTQFVDIFQKYDIISKKITIYAYLYPFIEIILGLSLIFKYKLKIINSIIIISMLINIISVSITLSQGQKLRCGCLGSFLHIPLSYVTLSENIIMLFMSTYTLI